MKASQLLILRNALEFQLTYRPGSENGIFLRDVPHFKVQYALRKNLDLLNKEADFLVQSVANLSTDTERKEAIDNAPDIDIENNFHKISIDEIPTDAKIDASGTWVLSHFFN